MEIKQNEKDIKILDVKNFDLGQTFDCGQCFRWEKIAENIFEGIAYGKKLRIYKSDNNIVLENTSKEEFEKVWKITLTLTQIILILQKNFLI